MAANDELNRLRAEARQRHRAATRKVSRLKTQRGVNLSGTKADPRRDLSRITKTYNRIQLRAYIRELNAFTDRKTQFVPDAAGRPVAGDLWKQYKQLEQAYNRRVDKMFSKVADIDLPTAGMTIGERMEMMTPRHPQALSPAVNAPYRPPSRKPTNFASERALKRLIGDMRDRLKPNYFNRLLKNAREEYAQMSALTNQPELDKAVAALTDDQFAVLWNYTAFATDESLKYERAKSLLAKRDRPFQAQAAESANQNAWELVEWAATLELGS